MAVRRGCGTRVHGGIYVESGGPVGLPIEAFLVDPAVPLKQVDPYGAVTPVGVHVLPVATDPPVFHLVDWVGAQHYPNVQDFIEETRRFGLSRRLPNNPNIVSKVSAATRVYLVHPRAVIHDTMPFLESDYTCPTGKHDDPDLVPASTTCAGFWREDVEGQFVVSGPPGGPAFISQRQQPSFTYTVRERVEHKGEYEPGVFMALPAERLVVIAKDGKRDEAVERAMEAAAQSPLPLVMEEE